MSNPWSRIKDFGNFVKDKVDDFKDFVHLNETDDDYDPFDKNAAPAQNPTSPSPTDTSVTSQANTDFQSLPDRVKEAALAAGAAAAGAGTLSGILPGSSATAGAGAGAATGSSIASGAASGLASGLTSGLSSGVSSWLPSLLSTLGSSALMAGFGVESQKLANEANKDIAHETNETNLGIARENLGYQRDLFDYNKDLQQQIFNREDSSYQRTVSDMRSAGLSPLMMSGTNGAGEAIAQTALNNGFQAQGYEHKALDLSAISSLFNLAIDTRYKLSQLDSLNLDNQSKALNNKLDSMLFSSKYDSGVYDSRLKSLDYENRYVKNLRDYSDYEYDKYYGFHSGMSESERDWRRYSRSLGFNPTEKRFNTLSGSTDTLNLPSVWEDRAFTTSRLADDLLEKINNIKNLIPKGPLEKGRKYGHKW